MNRNTAFVMMIATVLIPVASPARERLAQPLRLPPGLEQTIAINKSASYFGDALRAVHCPDDKDNPYGTCGNLLYGGLVMTFAHISGNVKIKFHPAVNDISHFEIRHPGGLSGDDGILSGPLNYSIPNKTNILFDDDGSVSEGDLNLATGEVTNLRYKCRLLNTAILMLGKTNPKLEAPTIRFPGTYGSSWAQFEQRPDGLLDFSFYGSTFLPLGKTIGGDPVRFPMPPCDLQLNCASIPAAGTSLHPQLRISTKALGGAACGNNCADFPEDTVREFTAFAHSSSFGDDFHLNIPALGGTGYGRSHLLGRVIVQFGKRFGDSLPFAVSTLPPTALLAEPPKTPLSIPGLSVGLLGHDEFLAFPGKTYFLQDVAFADDPFDIQIGAIDLKTGSVIGGLLYRGFIAQNLLFTLLEHNDGRIAPDSFQFRGPARFERGANGQLVFRFEALVELDFADFRFPSPDHVKANSWVAGEGSYLEPFLNIQAMSPVDVPRAVKTGSASFVSSTSESFSYSYSIPCDPAGKAASFEYTTRHPTNGGTFRMASLGSVSCTNSLTSKLSPGDYDTITFTGFGTWSADKDKGLHLATVQISTSPDYPYVSILIDGGLTSNVNTKPATRPAP